MTVYAAIPDDHEVVDEIVQIVATTFCFCHASPFARYETA
jgi:hypothetical protein